MFSWVSGDLQDKILELVEHSLSSAGRGLYQLQHAARAGTLRLVLREMLWNYAPAGAAATARIGQGHGPARVLCQGGRAAIDAVCRTAEDRGRRSLKQPDGYIYHEYFESDNRPLYFHEFVSQSQPV